MDRVKGKTVIVTGGSVGIGRATCLLLAEQGAKVAVTGKNDEGGLEVVDTITKNGGTAQFWHMNTKNEDEVRTVFASVYDTFGDIHGLVNNAGIPGLHKPTDEITEEEWDAVMDVNVKGVMFCTKHIIPYMRNSGGGSIVNLSSITGLVGIARRTDYCSSKGAVRLMTKADAMTFAPENIRVNSVHPGLTWTPLLESTWIQKRGFTREQLGANVPIGRGAEPLEIAYGILFLISDESSFMTGSEMVMDGGQTAQ